ncbi:ABC transporter ATP-binding protein [Motilimonas sp. KMU-193]|uniref:ABC transporter ATP-binding protein n=1 Tax=Motilimonas sp. KMU-193 TaxID=3388668 RepID=UPI00396B449F
MIQINNLSFRRRGSHILDAVNCDIKAAKITALIGPNGSGKSTLLKLIAGVLTPNSGQITINQVPLKQWPAKQLAKQLTMLPQHNQVPVGLTVKELVAMGRAPHLGLFGRLDQQDHTKIDWAMAQAHLTDWADRRVDQLSGGETQRCWLAMILAQDTDIVLLDEPTSYLDIGHQIELLEIVKTLNQQYQKTIVWVLHDLNQASAYSDEILLLDGGKLVAQGSPNQVLTAERASAIYQTPLISSQIGQQSILWPQAQTVTDTSSVTL